MACAKMAQLSRDEAGKCFSQTLGMKNAWLIMSVQNHQQKKGGLKYEL
jgi:hypothetical protein